MSRFDRKTDIVENSEPSVLLGDVMQLEHTAFPNLGVSCLHYGIVEKFAKPDETNNFLAAHINILRQSLKRWSGRDLVREDLSATDAAREVFHAPFAVVSHSAEPDPIFNYGNCTALRLFEMSWEVFTGLPSRLSAEPMERAERQRLLDAVSSRGYVDDYSGVRVSNSGKRFLIEAATVWTLVDTAGNYYGQAATFRHWRPL